MKNYIVLIFMFSILFSQEESIIYWNSLATDVTVGVPIAEDETLVGGRIQIEVSFDGGKSFNQMGEPFQIDEGDVDDLKQVSVDAEIFEKMAGFSEGGKAQFKATVWDRAGNSINGSVSDSILTIDEVLPTLVDLKVISSNVNKSLVMPDDSITFQLNTSEPIKKPEFIINGEYNDNAVGVGKSWMLVYHANDTDDGQINFEINYSDLAGNPAASVTVATDSSVITMDGTLPELTEINLYTNNTYDKSLAVKGDSVFLRFISSEYIKELNVIINNTDGKLLREEDLKFEFYHVFTESDSQGVIPFKLDYKDKAGNIGETIDETSDGSQVELDMQPPLEFKVQTVGSLQGESSRKAKQTKNKKIKSKSGGTSDFGLLAIIMLSVLSLSVLLVWISWFMIFNKAGQAGWKALIPLFNILVFTKIAGKPIWWIAIYIFLPLGHIISALDVSKLFGKKIIFAVGLILLPPIFYPVLAFGKAQYIKPKS